ncbi:hypothetical protein PC123_g15315 [Phytophthora cactorum]|nr:hypothetical protein PC123_g15315 [Phytophthora cactorum]
MDAFIVLAYLVWTTDPVTSAAVTRTEVGTCAKLLRTIAKRVAICGDEGRLKSTLLCSAEGVACLGIPVIFHIKARAVQGYRPLLSSSVLPRSKKLLRFTELCVYRERAGLRRNVAPRARMYNEK